MSEHESRLKNFPISWFSTVMGLAGLSIAWNRAEHFIDPGLCLSSIWLGLATLVFAVLVFVYALKIYVYPQEVRQELVHPVKQAFAPTVSIGMLLLSVAYLQISPQWSLVLWGAGTALQLVLTFYVLSSWMHHEHYQITHLNPAWFIPVVGNVIVPIAGLSHAPVELSWFFFSLGIFFWPILTAVIFYRLVFHTALPDRLMPTLFIFIAPPAVGFTAWVSLNGGVDAFARILFSVALVFTLLLLSQINRFRRLSFFLSWWAYSFPLAAMTIACFVMFKFTQVAFFLGLGVVMLGVLTLLIAVLFALTARAVWRKEICVAGH